MTESTFLDREYARKLINTEYDQCNICGMPMISNKCKITCLNCGFRRDCSDY